MLFNVSRFDTNVYNKSLTINNADYKEVIDWICDILISFEQGERIDCVRRNLEELLSKIYHKNRPKSVLCECNIVIDEDIRIVLTIPIK